LELFSIDYVFKQEFQVLLPHSHVCSDSSVI